MTFPMIGGRRGPRPSRQASAATPPDNSNFEILAMMSRGLPSRPDDAVGVLLAAACPSARGEIPVLRPLWAEEAMHRAYATLRLFRMLQQRRTAPDDLACRIEHALATQLAANFAALTACPDDRPVPCSRLLRDVVRDLGALFGPGVGHVAITTDIACLTLPAYQRRALVLLTSELVGNALTHAFRGRGGGSIAVDLNIDADGVRLRVADDGVGFRGRTPDTALGVAAGMASLLAGDLRYVRRPGWTTVAQVTFPGSVAA